jgi:DNA polymerase I
VEEGDYDADYYVNNQVIPAVFRILEALGYTEQELKGLGRQMTLRDWK